MPFEEIFGGVFSTFGTLFFVIQYIVIFGVVGLVGWFAFTRLKKFPVKVMIFKKYGNVVKPVLDTGRYEKKRIKTQDGFIENNYLILKKEKTKIPPPDIQFYYEPDGTARWLYLLQIDRYTYYPMSFEDGEMAVKVPVFQYHTDKKGNVLKDEKGKPRLILDEAGKPKIRYLSKKIFDSTIIFEKGDAIKLPNPIAHKTYDKEHWLSNEMETASRLYRSKAFWEKYGNVIIMGVVGIFIVMALYVGLTKYNEITKTLVDGLEKVSQNMNMMADKLRVAQSGQPVVPTTIPPY